jgi:hypothetical protein
VVDAENHEEEIFIRHIPPSVCEKNFPKWSEQVAREVADPDHPRKAPENARQEARLNVLSWTGKQCTRAQLNPESNQWEICKDAPKSLKAAAAVSTGGKRVGAGRARQGGASGSVDDDVVVSTSVVGGEIFKNYKIKISKGMLEPKVIDGSLYITTITAAPSEDSAEPVAGTLLDDAEED